MAIVIPNAKLIPMPPLRFTDETETAINVKIKTATGILQLFIFNYFIPSNI